MKYLGVWIKSNVRFKIYVSECRRKYFISANTVLSKCTYTCDMVKLKILESYCLPVLLYGSESGCYDDNSLSVFNCCWNSVYGKNFGYFRWESVRNILACLNKLNVEYLVNLRRILFIRKMSTTAHGNDTLTGVVNKYVSNNEFQTVLQKFDIDYSVSVSMINHKFHSHFLNTCHWLFHFIQFLI